MVTAFWLVLALIVAFAGFRYRQRLRGPVIDDAAINRIIDDGKLDLEEASEAEDEFWSEYWDEPDEYQR